MASELFATKTLKARLYNKTFAKNRPRESHRTTLRVTTNIMVYFTVNKSYV